MSDIKLSQKLALDKIPIEKLEECALSEFIRNISELMVIATANVYAVVTLRSFHLSFLEVDASFVLWIGIFQVLDILINLF